MLTNERLTELSGMIGVEVADTLTPTEAIGMARELLALRTLPEMGEIDAIENWLEGKEIEFGVVRRIHRLRDMLKSAIANAEAQRKRAEEAERLLRKFIASKDGAMQEIREWATEDPDCRRIIELCGEGE